MFEPEIILGIIENTIKNNGLFGDLLTPDNKAYLVQHSLVRPALVGEILCHQDQSDKSVFFIVKGEVEVTSQSKDKITVLGKLGQGELVGEVAVLFRIPRIATVTVTQPSVVLEIPTEVLADVLHSNKELQQAVIKRCKNRIVETSLLRVPVIKKLDSQSFSELCYLSSLVKAEKGAVIANQGKKERSMYIICSGVAKVYVTVNGKDITIAHLQPGDYFGEHAFFTGAVRSASVVALSDLQLVVLEGESFHSFIEYNEDLENDIGQLSKQRQIELGAKRRDIIQGGISLEQRFDQVIELLEDER